MTIGFVWFFRRDVGGTKFVRNPSFAKDCVLDHSPPFVGAGTCAICDNQPYHHQGSCPICGGKDFVAKSSWLRDNYICKSCKSIPRERALALVLKSLYPNWRTLHIHESSPTPRGVSMMLSRECKHYTASQYLPELKPGEFSAKFQAVHVDLAKQPFDDKIFDLVISLDVFEHVEKEIDVFREIERTLKPGGAHIFTVPLVNKERPSIRVASKVDGQWTYVGKREVHGNPVDSAGGSLVIHHWGYDIGDKIFAATGMTNTIYEINCPKKGIVAEYIDVVVSRKEA